MSKHEEIVNRIVNLANAKFPESEVYLYGSQARGDANSLSDWDILILLSAEIVPFEYEIKLMDDIYELELETGKVLSPLIYSKSDWIGTRSITPLYNNILHEGIKIK